MIHGSWQASEKGPLENMLRNSIEHSSSNIVVSYSQKLIIPTSFCSFWTDLSANSALASACFSLAVRFLMFSL